HAFTLGIRQYKEHDITADNLDNLKENTEYLWEQAINKKITPEKLTIKSRALQDEIYNHRCTNPLIFDWIYRRLRNANEEQMNKAADVLVNEALMSTSLEKNEKKET
ncbi:MAG: hypothetical protein H8D67_24675, partial [Deltaproteobacteria bacterium]|nr:hypothetical protein [Deltaproteobacteria bacterium]